MASHARYDPPLKLDGIKLKEPSDFQDLVCRLDIFASIAFQGKDEDAVKRLPSTMLLGVINLVPADCPHGKLMVGMIRGITHSSDPKVRSAWKDHSPASDAEVTARDRSSTLWGPDVPISKPLFKVLQFWAKTILSRHALWWCDEMITLERWLTKGEIYSTGGNST